MSKSPTHIAAIGAGQIGSRHIQALKKIDRKILISVIGPNLCALELAKKIHDETSPKHQEGRWKVAEGSFKMPLQSELTHLTVQEDSR